MAILDGTRVLDLSQGFAGSLATMLLADNGAQVTKIEPPDGDPWRSQPAWIMWNRGKRSVVLDLETATGCEHVQGLARTVDVVVENFIPGTAERLGLGYEPLAWTNAGLIYCSITAFGKEGEFAQLPPYDGIVAAKTGDSRGATMGASTREEPIYSARPIGSFAAANHAVQGIVAALRVRHRTGVGQWVETTICQGVQTYDFLSGMARQQELGLMARDADAEARAPAASADINLPYLVARCRDGQWIQMTCLASRLFPNWMKAIGLGHIYEEERFKGAPGAFKTREDKLELRRMIHQAMLTKTLDEWLAIFTANDVAGDRIITTQQAMDHPQMQEIGAVIDVDDPSVGWTKQIGPLVRFSETPSEIRGGAPLLGQYTEEALAEVASIATAGTATPAAKGNTPQHPLDGLLVLDFSSWLAAPVGSALIADLGARVIKVKPPLGDEFRNMSKGRARTFQGKESLVLDLKTPEARTALEKLIARADVLMHNMRGEAPIRLGIDYETVRKINPNIVYLYAASYGSTGPGAGRAAFHPTAGALTGGLLWQIGRGNEPPPPDTLMNVDDIGQRAAQIYAANGGSPDVTAAIGVATALTLAMYEKERTGHGQYVETSMLTSNSYVCSDDFIRYPGKPDRLLLDKNQQGTHALNRIYRTSQGWLYVTCQLPDEWAALCHALARAEWLSDARFSTREARLRHDDQLTAALALALKGRTADDWESYLWSKDVPVARADGTRPDDFMLTSDTSRKNGFVVEASRPSIGTMYRQGPAVRFSLTPARADLAYAFGENTEAILREIGMPAEEIARLKDARIAVTT